MNSMPEPSNPRTIDNPDFREGYAEGFLDAAQLKVNQAIIEAAMAALRPFYPKSPQEVADLLRLWIRRDEMTDADVVEVGNRLFPKPLDRKPCPAWCTHDHAREPQPNEIDDLVDHYRQLVEERDDSGLALDVAVHQTDVLSEPGDAAAGIYVYSRDHLTPAQARRLIAAVEQGLAIIA